MNVPPTSTPTRSGAAQRLTRSPSASSAARRSRSGCTPKTHTAPEHEDGEQRGLTAIPSRVGWMPVSSARKTGSRAQSPSIGVALDHVDRLQRAHGVAREGDREQQQDRGAGDQHRLERQLAAEPRIGVGDPAERERGGRGARARPRDQPLGEEGQRLVEEHRLEALAEDRREAEPREGGRAVPRRSRADTRARMNSIRRRCSRRETSQKLTMNSTPTASRAVARLQQLAVDGGESITSVVVSANVDGRRGDGAARRPRRADGGSSSACAASSEPSRIAISSTASSALAEEDREREPEGEQPARRRPSSASSRSTSSRPSTDLATRVLDLARSARRRGSRRAGRRT